MSDKTIVRVKKNRDNPYVQIRKTVFEDSHLSWKAKGLMGYFLSRPDDWTIRIGDLIKKSTDGEASIRAGMKELEKFGYLENRRIVDPDTKRVVRWEKIVYESPMGKPDSENHYVAFPDGDFPHVEEPDLERPHVENQRLLINERIKQVYEQKNENNNNNDVVALQREIESYLGVSIRSLLKFLPKWLDSYGHERLVELAQHIGSTPRKWSNIVGTYRTAVTEVWEPRIQAIPTKEKSVKDERYRAFYELFPDA